jgi:3-methyl-2-oxobutanoate hydroxymethyltransferase
MMVLDMPFGSYEESPQQAFRNAARLMSETGAGAVKLEGGRHMAETIAFLVARGVPVMAHIGLTPQSINTLGGYKVQGRDETAAQTMINDAITLVEAGADFVLLECVPTELARAITEAVPVPVIGIGAGNVTDAQVLVSYDMLGFTQHRLPRFVKNYMATPNTLAEAVTRYIEEVKSGAFPGPEHAFD